MASKYEQLVEALRHCSHDGLVKCNECQYGGIEWPIGCEEEMMQDAAAAIEALQARLGEAENSVERWKDMYLTKHEPKLGKWKPFDLTYGRSLYYCSVCEQATEVPMCMEKPMYAYCPNCGAKMEVQ